MSPFKSAAVIPGAACLCALMFYSSACFAAKRPDDARRAQTLRLLPHDSVPRIAIKEASKKTAVVIHGMPARFLRSDTNSVTVSVGGAPNSWVGSGIAVAIDRDGYFLTAAHLIDSPFISLAFHDGQQWRAEPARVVAMIQKSTKKHGPSVDVAILHIAGVHLANVFTFSDEAQIEPGSIALEIGAAEKRLLSETNMLVQPALLAGRIKKIWKLRAGGEIISSDHPVRGGDSGGPLFSATGELIAIHSGKANPFWTSRYAVATRPDLNWLRKTINDDKQTEHENVAPKFPENAIEPVLITIRSQD